MSPDSSDAVQPAESELVERLVAEPRWSVGDLVESPVGSGRVTEVAWRPDTSSYWVLVDWSQHHLSEPLSSWLDEAMVTSAEIS